MQTSIGDGPDIAWYDIEKESWIFCGTAVFIKTINPDCNWFGENTPCQQLRPHPTNCMEIWLGPSTRGSSSNRTSTIACRVFERKRCVNRVCFQSELFRWLTLWCVKFVLGTIWNWTGTPEILLRDMRKNIRHNFEHFKICKIYLSFKNITFLEFHKKVDLKKFVNGHKITLLLFDYFPVEVNYFYFFMRATFFS